MLQCGGSPPTDYNLLEGSKLTDYLLDKFCSRQKAEKPRTHCVGRQAFISSSKKKRKGKKLIYKPEFIIDGFYDRPFAQQNLVIQWHEPVFHIAFQASDNYYTIVKQSLKQALQNISFVCE